MMKKLRFTILVFLLLGAMESFAAPPTDRKGVLGTWEGESKCTVANSPCHDEHVIYRLAADKRDPNQVRLDAYKVVDGQQQFMGTLDCSERAATLACTGHSAKQDDWEFKVDGDSMSGTLTIDNGKTLYRNIRVHRRDLRQSTSGQPARHQARSQ